VWQQEKVLFGKTEEEEWMIVYAKVPYAYVWADNNMTHKQGKVYPETPLTVKSQSGDWLFLEPLDYPAEIDRLVDVDKYPNFLIRKEDVVQSHGDPGPDPDPEPDFWLIRLIKWLVELLYKLIGS
jgi:hypothetical protein